MAVWILWIIHLLPRPDRHLQPVLLRRNRAAPIGVVDACALAERLAIQQGRALGKPGNGLAVQRQAQAWPGWDSQHAIPIQVPASIDQAIRIRTEEKGDAAV